MERIQGVVAGILRRAAVAAHPPHATVSRAPLKVCFPGGTIDPGETPQQAVVAASLARN